MRFGNDRFHAAAVAGLAVLFAALVYRAATQSVVHDEAYTFNAYLGGPWADIWRNYTANNHFLATLAFRLTTGLFGTSELAFRLPVLAAAALYFRTVLGLNRDALGGRWLSLLGTAVLVLNPLVLDFLVAARGYGMALAFLSYGLWALVRFSAANERNCELRAGLALALSVAANLAFLFPVLALAACFVLAHRTLSASPGQDGAARDVAAAATEPRTGKRKRPGRDRRKPATPPAPLLFSKRRGALRFAAALGGGLALFWLAAPVYQAKEDAYYVGHPTVASSLADLVAASFTHNEGWGRVLVPLRDGTGWPLAAGVLLAALTMAYTGAGYSISRRKTGAAGIAAETTGALADPAPAPQLPTPAPPGAAALLALLAGGTAGVSLLLQAAANLAFQVPYSTDRTGLYYAVLVPVCVLSGSAALWRGGGIARWPAAPGIICACIASALYVVQLQVSHFRVWRYDADTRQILQQLRTILPAGSPPVALGGSWELEPSINFYQSARRWQWLQPFDRGAAGSGFPYYIFIPKDHDQIAQRSLQVIFRGPTSGTVLAAPERHTR